MTIVCVVCMTHIVVGIRIQICVNHMHQGKFEFNIYLLASKIKIALCKLMFLLSTFCCFCIMHVGASNKQNTIIYRLLQDVSNSTIDVCDSSIVKKKMVVTWGQSLHLGCFLKIPAVLSTQTITWYHYSKEKGRYEIVFR